LRPGRLVLDDRVWRKARLEETLGCEYELGDDGAAGPVALLALLELVVGRDLLPFERLDPPLDLLHTNAIPSPRGGIPPRQEAMMLEVSIHDRMIGSSKAAPGEHFHGGLQVWDRVGRAMSC
jgi:hypothetical protein